MTETEKKLQQHVDRFIDLRFYQFLDQEEEVYRTAFVLSTDIKQPDLYKGGLNYWTVVDPRIPTPLVSQAAGIYEWISSKNFSNTTNGIRTPYVIWTHDGSLYSGYSPKKAVEHFTEEEEGVNFSELLALYLAHPDFFKERAIVAGETTYEAFGKNHPHISTWGRKPAEVFLTNNLSTSPYLGVLSRGKQIILLGS